MNVTTEKVGTAVVARVEGELDMASSDQLRDKIDEKLKTYETIRDIFLVLDSVSFIDSSGLAVLLGRYRKAQERGGRLAVVNPTPQVRRVMELSGLTKLVGIYENLNETREEMGGAVNA